MLRVGVVIAVFSALAVAGGAGCKDKNKNKEKSPAKSQSGAAPTDANKTPPTKSASWTPPTRAEVDEHPEWVACETDADCEIVELGCCDRCNGGTALSVNSAAKDKVAKEWGEAGCKDRACTELGCSALKTRCREKECVGVDEDGKLSRSNPLKM
jgi:hypothetical protein